MVRDKIGDKRERVSIFLMRPRFLRCSAIILDLQKKISSVWNVGDMFSSLPSLSLAKNFSIKPVPVGVPQGSILGPLLFLVYVNDLPSCLRECDLTLYADDTVIYVSAKDAATLESRLNIDLQSISKWFFDNLLTLNENKCKFVLFGSSQKLKSSQNFSLCINDYNLERTDSFKYLGVTNQSKYDLARSHFSDCQQSQSTPWCLEKSKSDATTPIPSNSLQ